MSDTVPDRRLLVQPGDAKVVRDLVQHLKRRGIGRTVTTTSDFDDFLQQPCSDQPVTSASASSRAMVCGGGMPTWLILNGEPGAAAFVE